jgi:hypothetical protein
MAFLTASAVRLGQADLAQGDVMMDVYARSWLIALVQVTLVALYLWLVRGALETDRLKPPVQRARQQARGQAVQERNADDAEAEQRRRKLLTALVDTQETAGQSAPPPAPAAAMPPALPVLTFLAQPEPEFVAPEPEVTEPEPEVIEPEPEAAAGGDTEEFTPVLFDVPSQQFTLGDQEEAEPAPTAEPAPEDELLAAVPPVVAAAGLEGQQECLCALLTSALAAGCAAGVGAVESVLLAGPDWISLVQSPGATGSGFYANRFPDNTNIRLATLALRQQRQALAGMDLPDVAVHVPLPPPLPAFEGETPEFVADLVAAEVGAAFAAGPAIMLGPDGQIAAATAALWDAACALNPGGERLWLSASAGGLIVARIEGVIVAMTASAASELAACNLWLNQLQAEAQPGSGG